MVNLVVSAGQLLLALFLVVLNGFFVASEFAFVRIRSTSVDQMAAEGRTGSGRLQAVMEDLDDYLATTQLGITVASLGLGWVGEPALADLVEFALVASGIGPVLSESMLSFVGFAIGFSTITFLHVVFGELAPKTLAIAQAERLSLFVAPPMTFFYYLFYPGIVVFNGAANAFTSFLGVPPASETDETLEEREIRRVLARSGEQGTIDLEEVDMIEQVFELDDTVVREVMVPRPDVITVSADTPLADARKVVYRAEHTRYPVTAAEDPGEVVGYVDVKDLLRASESDDGTRTVGDIVRDVVVVPETKTAKDLLVEFQDQHQQMAAIVDEWGTFEGIVTVEDLVEVVVGNIRDEFDVDEREPSIRQRDDGGYHVDGGVPLSVVNDTLGVGFESDEVETVGGLVLYRLDRVPERGDALTVDGHVVEVTEMDGARVATVRVTESPTEEGPIESSEADDPDAEDADEEH